MRRGLSKLWAVRHSASDHEAIGPRMPPHAIGPAAPSTANPTSDSDSGSDSDLVGPSIALAGYTESDAAQQTLDTVESRMCRQDKANQTPEEDKREEWMLLPPSVESTSAVRGSKAGKKGSMVAPLFDKSWTETPEERRARKKGKGRSGKCRETEVEEETPGMRKKRIEDEEKGRWVEEFDRSRDLSAGKVDERKQRELLNTMGFLTDKYAPSKGGSFM
ncbi:hypothetical protein BX661DRAFT_181068 [Kickxella alabastrina]|uniref:uncharacterized protein n=1 Tax=Kickxella alabastrina TaxID=61397 RepID=UPI002220BFAC|nr:uncharacterized protein BX661DRAFT_181068 [Kickxella alabastrina]KAI7830094.1 hypothetical protein BX661DRAFT_181068 [Kickxella alabastrina]